MSGRHHHEPSRHNLEVSNHPNYHANAHAHSAPHRPHRSKRAIPDPAGAPALGSSLSQLSLQDDLASSLHSSLPSSPSTVSLASSLVDIRQLDSGVDLQEAPKPVNRRSNRGFRIIQPTEMDEFNLQESIRHSKAAQKPLPPQPTTVLNQDQDDKDDDKDDDDDEESYFGDILDKYCDSDEDPASPTSPASKLPSWKDLHTAQPPTPPVSRSLNAQQTNTASRRAPTASSAPSPTPTARRDNHSSSSPDGPLRREPGSDRTGTRSRENSVSSSPMNPASAKFNMYLHAGAAQESRDSLAKSSSTASSSSASSTARAYTKRPPPPPKDQAPNSFQQQQPPLLDERSRSYSHGAASAATSSSTPHGYPSSSRGLKSTLVKTPIARARAKEAHGPRKVLFGDMITIVSIERAETPPPPPVLDKKARKKLLQAKKNAASKEGKGGGPIQNFDPEYDAAYYNAPFTPTPAEVVVTLAPWIGNPNYDEEKANSKFYYDDEYDYDDEDEYDYDTSHASDIRLGPEDDDEDDEDEDDEDDEEYASRSWGHGIAGPGGSLPKKKGGMFKFKRAVNKLFLN
ncbi:hypothetical protein BGZ75_009180 [Mortierella antarctica]|nr:hypothetical protein BGZ75_009180 [Mortierella antarctica]